MLYVSTDGHLCIVNGYIFFLHQLWLFSMIAFHHPRGTQFTAAKSAFTFDFSAWHVVSEKYVTVHTPTPPEKLSCFSSAAQETCSPFTPKAFFQERPTEKGDQLPFSLTFWAHRR